MKTLCWYFNDSDQNLGLDTFCDIKTSVKSAAIALKTRAKPTVCVVYPLPWLLPATSLGEWLDFYIDAFALAQDYPDQVQLWPVDEFFKHHQQNCTHQQWPGPDSLQAFLSNQQHPEVANLLEMMEMNAILHQRGPYTKPLQDTLSPQQVQQIVELLNAPPVTQQVVDNTQLKVLQQQLETAQRDVQQITEALLNTQVETEKLALENQALRQAQAAQSTNAESAPAELLAELAEKKNALHELEIRHQSAIEEAGFMQVQIHKIFEQLEKTHFECEHLKHEAELARAAMQQMSLKLSAIRQTPSRSKAA